jgi:hypothetical protein
MKIDPPFFSRDERLSKILIESSPKETLRIISDKIKKVTQTKVNAGDRGLISYATNKSPVWELMEAISAVDLSIWKQENRGYKLYEPSWFFDSGYGAKNEYMLRRFQAGMAFISNLEKMPKALQDKIFVKDLIIFQQTYNKTCAKFSMFAPKRHRLKEIKTY